MNEHHTLDAWLAYLESVHNKSMDLALDRIHQVRLSLNLMPTFPIITVGGTNGKGSVCAMLSTILCQAGYKVGTYTSPHVLRYNERIAVNLQAADDQTIVKHLFAVDKARGSTALTIFEFLTLAAMHYFMEASVDVAVLEVGLGGRLDAVNLFDAQAAVVTNVDLDHCDWLGNTKEAIGYEKAGIFRSGCPAIIGDKHPPQTLLRYAKKIAALTYIMQRDFLVEGKPDAWDLKIEQTTYRGLQIPHLQATYQMSNAALALATLYALRTKLPVSHNAMQQGLLSVKWPWRLQCLTGKPSLVLDVAHNTHAALQLVKELALLPIAPRQLAVFSMLADKDIAAVLACTKEYFDAWYVAGLGVERGLSTDALAYYFKAQNIQSVHYFDHIADAWLTALSDATACDRIVAFGSFYTIAAVEQVRKINHEPVWFNA